MMMAALMAKAAATMTVNGSVTRWTLIVVERVSFVIPTQNNAKIYVNNM